MWFELFLNLFYIVLLVKVFCLLTLGRCKSNKCLNGKTALVTGGNSGIGLNTAKGLASRGCRVIIADITDATQTRLDIIKETSNPNIIVKKVDFQSFDSVRSLAKDINETEEKLDILLNNAGIGANTLVTTKDGLPRTLQVNYFSHFLLTYLLLDLLKKSAPSRIIFTSSLAAYLTSAIQIDELLKPSINKQFDFKRPAGMYGDSKLLLAVAAAGFAKKLQGTGVTSNALHPGAVNTQIFINAWKNDGALGAAFLGLFPLLLGKNSQEGAQTLLHLACANEVENLTGQFFMDCTNVFKPSSMKNQKYVDDVFCRSEEICQISEEIRI